jgi:hypothetical protein
VTLLRNVLLKHKHNLLLVIGNLKAKQLKALNAQGLSLVLGFDVIGGLELACTLLHIIIVFFHNWRTSSLLRDARGVMRDSSGVQKIRLRILNGVASVQITVIRWRRMMLNL